MRCNLKQIHAGLDDIYALHEFVSLRAAFLKGVDTLGIAVMDSKSIDLCKYAIRNAA